MKRNKFAFVIAALAFVLASLLGAVAAPMAQAAGVEVYRTDSQGYKTGTVTSVGDTGPSAFCAKAGIGAIRLGVKVCYL